METASTCPRCGKDNPQQASYCLACAAPLTSVDHGVREERKVVSVLFVDLVDFTAASDSADPEDVRAQLRSFHARAKREIERYGGTVEKFIGDAVMAVFGAPTVHEDDAERAVRAGLAVLDAVGADARAAVNTGEAVVTLTSRPEAGEGFVAGDVVNTAARLQSAAAPGALIVGEATFLATKARIEYEQSEHVRAKGKSAPLAAWLARAPRGRLGVDVERSRHTPFVGREDDLALIQSAYRKAVAESSVQLVTVTGEPGVGKSRLAAEFRSFVDERPELVSWRQGRCPPYGEGITFWALGEIVKAEAGILESDPPAKVGPKLDAVLARLGERDRGWVRSRIAPLIGLSTEEGDKASSQEESFNAWRTFLEALAAERPLVVLFEDLHWADPSLLSFVDHVVEWATGVPLLVLCTARPELYERDPGWGGGKRNSATVALSPLTADQTARLVAGLLERAVLPAATQTVLLERAGGNPLFAVEFVRMLTDHEALDRRGRLATSDIRVPETLRSVIAARLDTLPADRKALVQDAAVVGKVFWPGTLASMGARSEVEARDGIHELARREFVRPARVSTVEGEPEFSFWHAIVRDVAYGQIPRAEGVRKHMAAAQWIERLSGERVGDQAELIVHHYETALALAEATGDQALQEQLKAPLGRFLLAAAEHTEMLDLVRAEALYRRALELTSDEPTRARATVGLAETEVDLGRQASARPRFEAAIAAFESQGDRIAAGSAMTHLARLYWHVGDSPRGVALCGEAVAVLETEPPGPELAWALAELTAHHALAGRFLEALALAERALPLAEQVGNRWATVRTLNIRGFARCATGLLDAGMGDLDAALQFVREHGIGIDSYVNAGDWQWMQYGPAKALVTFREAMEVSERRGLFWGANWARSEMCWLLYDLGDWDELLRLAGEVAAWDRSQGPTTMEPMVLTYQGLVLAQRGNLAEARALMDEFLPAARRVADNPQVLPQALLAAAAVQQATSGPEAAQELLAELDRVTRDKGWARALVAPEASRLAVRGGSPALARRLLDGLRSGATREVNAIATTEAILAEERGDLADAADRYSDVATSWAAFGHPFERAHALMGLGRALVRSGRPGAEAPLEESRRLLLALGAAPLLAEADELLAAATALSS